MRILLTGGGGLLGRATATALIERGDDVTVLQRRAAGLDCREIRADITDELAVRRAAAGQEAVLHLAAKVGVAGSPAEFRRVNVAGTRTVLAAARAAGAARFVQVSSPSVAHAGKPLVGAPAGPADPLTARSEYARTKASAELLALAADRPELAVLAVRPHLVWGPGDTQLVGPIVARARAGRLVLVGSGAALIDTTYVDNAVDALLAAVDAGPDVHGEALVVTNGEPRPVGEILTRICAAAGTAGPHRSVPLPVAAAAGAVVEMVWRWARRRGDPPLTRFLAEQLGTAHWFDQRRTRQLLSWTPRVSLDDGFHRLARAGIETAAARVPQPA